MSQACSGPKVIDSTYMKPVLNLACQLGLSDALVSHIRAVVHGQVQTPHILLVSKDDSTSTTVLRELSRLIIDSERMRRSRGVQHLISLFNNNTTVKETHDTYSTQDTEHLNMTPSQIRTANRRSKQSLAIAGQYLSNAITSLTNLRSEFNTDQVVLVDLMQLSNSVNTHISEVEDELSKLKTSTSNWRNIRYEKAITKDESHMHNPEDTTSTSYLGGVSNSLMSSFASRADRSLCITHLSYVYNKHSQRKEEYIDTLASLMKSNYKGVTVLASTQTDIPDSKLRSQFGHVEYIR